jgi:hypothetical protein
MDKWSDKIFDKFVLYIESEKVQNTINKKLLNPILNHVLKRMFPYIVLICIMFILLLISVLITLGVILFQTRLDYTYKMNSVPVSL